MAGPHLLIVAIIIALVIAFVITLLVLNASARKIIDTNTRLVDSHNKLLELNQLQSCEIEQRRNEMQELDSKLERQKSELDEQKEMIETLLKQQREQPEQQNQARPHEVLQLQQQIQGYREQIEKVADMTDVQLMAWIDLQMDETKLYTDPNLPLKSMAKALGLTQKRLRDLFKHHPVYGSLGEYINEKRFLYACQLLREEPNWTIEAVGAQAGFGCRRTFQTEVKRRLGITPLQYRQSQAVRGE